MQKLLIATTNKGKIKEIKELLKDLPVRILNLSQVSLDKIIVKETGKTFEENALIKAKKYFKKSGFITLAEDSGLEIDALGGKPGVYSARFLKNKNDEEKNQAILNKMKKVPKNKRTARFKIAVAIVGLNGKIKVIEEKSEGKIALEARGNGGFGYDPIFITKGRKSTNGELSFDEKIKISFRTKALLKSKKILEGFIKC